MVTFDIDFVQAPRAISGVILYRKRSSYLYAKMIATMGEIARRSGRVLDTQDSKALARLWNFEGLFPAIKLCELHGKDARRQFNRLEELFDDAPAEPCVIIVNSATWNSLQRANIAVIDEPIVTGSNIATILEFLASQSKFPAARDLVKNKTFVRHFRRWVEDEAWTLLPRVAKEFDRAILLYTKPGSAAFSIPPAASAEFRPRSLLHGALSRYLDNPTARQMRGVIQAVAWRTERGVGPSTLVDQLLRISSDIVAARCRKGRGSFAAVEASPEAALLWAAILLSQVHRFERASVPPSLIVSYLLHEFERRLARLSIDPLEGLWSSLVEVPADTFEEESQDLMPVCELWSVLLAQSRKRQTPAWLQTIASLRKAAAEVIRLSDSYLNVDDQSDEVASFDELFGQKPIIDALRERFAYDRHNRPLMLAGLPGSGKRTLARLYAKSLLCEGHLTESMNPCGRCISCQRFASSSLWGYLEFDMTKTDISYWCKYHIDLLRYEPLSERRVVILKNVERSDEGIDTFLKTVENGVKLTTFVLLTDCKEAVRKAAASRSDQFVLTRLDKVTGRSLLRRWLPAPQWDEEMLDLITAHGDGLPGMLWHLSKMMIEAKVSTFAEVIKLFDATWGGRTLDYLIAFLERSWRAQQLVQEIDADPRRAVQCIRQAISVSIAGEMRDVIALWGLQLKFRVVDNLIEHHAAIQGIAKHELWDRLAAHWSRDTVADRASLVKSDEQAAVLLDSRAVFAQGR